MLKLGEKIIKNLYLGDRAIKKAYLGDKLVYKKAGGRFVKSILFDENSFVNTGIKHQTCTIECRIRFEETGTRQLMGFSLSTAGYWGAGASGTFDYLTNTNALDMTDVVLEFNTDNTSAPTLTLYADGRSRTSTGTTVTSGNYKIGSTGDKSGDTYLYSSRCEVEYNKTTINGELIQDLRPYVDENNVACFKDIVTGNLFYNQGTGTLGYTE